MFEIILDFLKILATFLALLIAYAGLNSWVRQLYGTSEYEVARRIQRCLFAIREGISLVRACGIYEGETSRATELAQTKNYSNGPDHIREIVHQNRWQHIQQPLAELETILLEAETLWGSAFPNKFDELRKILRTLNLNVGYYLDGIANPTIRNHQTENWLHIAAVALDSGTREQPDEFQKGVNTALEDLDSLVQPHIHRLMKKGPIQDALELIRKGRY